MANVSHATVARLAHRALRLREAGVDSEKMVRQLDQGPRVVDPDVDQTVQFGKDAALSGIASRLVDAMEADREGPTARKLVERLMTYKDLGSIWKQWDDAVTANLEETLDDKSLQKWRESVARDEAVYKDNFDLMSGASERELIERFEAMLNDSDLSQAEQDVLRERMAVPSRGGGEKRWDVHPAFGHMRHLDGAANAFYDLGREGFADGTIAWTATPTHKLYLLDSADYTVNLATHQFVSSIAVAAREEVTAALASKTKAAGVLDAADTVFTAAAGDPCEAMALAMTSALAGGADVADTSQRLIGYLDSFSPVTLNGGNVDVIFDNGSNRIAKL